MRMSKERPKPEVTHSYDGVTLHVTVTLTQRPADYESIHVGMEATTPCVKALRKETLREYSALLQREVGRASEEMLDRYDAGVSKSIRSRRKERK